MRPGRSALAALLLSWCVWAFVALHLSTPTFPSWHTLRNGDHWSHYGNAALFLSHGFDVYREPAVTWCHSGPTPELATFRDKDHCPSDCHCNAPNSSRRPLCLAWQQWPQAYPPGMLLYFLPEALLYLHTSLSFSAVNLFSVLKGLAGAHLFLWVLLALLFAPAEGGWEASAWLRWGLYGFVYLDVIKWTLEGFYDPIALFPMCLGIHYLSIRRSTNALVALATSLFLHYRALWYLPLFAAAAFGALRERGGSSSKGRFAFQIALAALLIGLAGFAFWLLLPTLFQYPHSNPGSWKELAEWKEPSWSLLGVAVLVLGHLAWERRWLLLATAAWQLVMVFRTLQIMPWHGLFLLPMLALARRSGGRGTTLAVLVLYVAERAIVCGALPWPGDLISSLHQAWAPLWRP